MRRPFHEADVDRNLSTTPLFQRYFGTNSGSIVATAAVDGVERLYSFRHVGNLPLILSIGIAVDDIYAAWWRKALGIGVALAALCATTVALCLLSRREILRRTLAEGALVDAANRLSIMATTDALTGLANRRAFEDALTEEWRRAIRSEASIALLMLDADCFKLFNDRYGHPEGDRVLKGIAQCIAQSGPRPSDMGARYGGEEFVVLLPDTEFPGALVVAERIRSAVAALDIPHAGSPSGRVTISLGVAIARPVLGDAKEWLVKQADDALYEAKRTGRNRVSAALGFHPAVRTWQTAPEKPAGPVVSWPAQSPVPPPPFLSSPILSTPSWPGGRARK
jgi:diguanylate cyclase (GGDEF)-like protein